MMLTEQDAARLQESLFCFMQYLDNAEPVHDLAIRGAVCDELDCACIKLPEEFAEIVAFLAGTTINYDISFPAPDPRPNNSRFSLHIYPGKTLMHGGEMYIAKTQSLEKFCDLVMTQLGLLEEGKK